MLSKAGPGYFFADAHMEGMGVINIFKRGFVIMMKCKDNLFWQLPSREPAYRTVIPEKRGGIL